MHMLTAFVLLAASVTLAAPDEEGLVAHWNFDEGEGAVLRDQTDNGNDGTIHGASWIASGDGFALRFDGEDDYVDCGAGPSLNLTTNATLEAWVCPEAPPGAGEPGIVGKTYSSYVLTYYTDGRCWWYISGGGNNCKAPLGAGAWHHLVGTFDGEVLRLYMDGVLSASKKSGTAKIGAGKSFLMGTSSGDAQFTRGAHFEGTIDEVRVYDRALSAQEVAHHYRTTHVTGEITMQPHLYPFANRVTVSLDLRGLGELPEGATVYADFHKRGRPLPAKGWGAVNAPRWGTLEADFDLAQHPFDKGQWPPGEYEVMAQVHDKDGQQIGKTAMCQIKWPQPPKWENAPKARALNNLVTELLDVKSPPRGARSQFSFVNPRDGWVFISCGAFADPANEVELALDGEPIQTLANLDTVEAMRLLPEGPHRLNVTVRGEGILDRVIVRAIPELVYAQFGAHPHVHEYGKYDWEFLSKHVLPNINVMTSGGGELGPYIEQWKAQGKKWIVHASVPGLRGDATVAADEAEKYWSEHRGMTDPLIDGIIVDEFGGSESEKYAAWTEAIRRIRNSDEFKGKLFYPYCGTMYGAKASRGFIQEVMDAGWNFAYERYLPEQRSEAAARAYLDSTLRRSIAAWREAMPGAEQHMIVCMGIFSQPPESLDVNPATNYKRYLDMQLNLLANDPACFGLRGVMTYLSSYADEETVRWTGKLFRHYCIEGNSRPLCLDPLMLPHLGNPDFEDGTNEWTVSEAEADSIATKTVEGFSWLEGRYPRTSEGDTVLWMKRSSRKPNVISQTVRALEPGRLHSLRMYSGDFKDPSVKQTHAISITLSDVEVLADKSFQHVFPNCYSHHWGPFNREHRAWMNYHWMIFRPQATEAKLEISDWSSETEPGGPIGQELIMNFVEVQPYDAP